MKDGIGTRPPFHKLMPRTYTQRQLYYSNKMHHTKTFILTTGHLVRENNFTYTFMHTWKSIPLFSPSYYSLNRTNIKNIWKKQEQYFWPSSDTVLRKSFKMKTPSIKKIKQKYNNKLSIMNFNHSIIHNFKEKKL